MMSGYYLISLTFLFLKSWKLLVFLEKMRYDGYVIRHVWPKSSFFTQNEENPLRLKFITLRLLQKKPQKNAGDFCRF